MLNIFVYNDDFFYKKVLGLSDGEDELNMLLTDKASSYTSRKINKKSGYRILNCINSNSNLYTLQKNLQNRLLFNIPLPDVVFGFVSGRSYKDFLTPHIMKQEKTRFFLRIDIENFFGSIKENLLYSELSYIIKLNDQEKKDMVLSSIVNLTTLNGELPQGAVTSPTISNIVFRRADQRIYKYAKKHNVTYTRYADDLLFSTENVRVFKETNIKYFIKMIIKILHSFGLEINRQKTRYATNRISLNGFVIDNEVRISRRKKHDISKILFLFEHQGRPKTIEQYLQRLNNDTLVFRENPFQSKQQIINYLAGYRAFLIDWLPNSTFNSTYEKDSKLIQRIESLILNLDAL